MIEAVGLIAGVLVVLSFVFRKEAAIRKANTLGSVAFIIYGFLIKSWSIVICNGVLLVIHFVRLRDEQD